MLLTCFELSSLVQSHMQKLLKNTLNKTCTAYNRFNEYQSYFFEKAVRRYIKYSMSKGYEMFLKLKYLINSK